MSGWRLFVAAPVPAATRTAMVEWVESWEARRRGWRPVRAEGIHLTLRFLGETDPALVPRLGERLAAAAAGAEPCEGDARGWGVFPGPGRPRVLWGGIRGDLEPLAALARGIESVAVDLGFPRERRPFRPHLTLARARRDGRPLLPGRPDPTAPAFGPVPLREVVLYRSHLEPGGARYEVLDRWTIGGGA